MSDNNSLPYFAMDDSQRVNDFLKIIRELIRQETKNLPYNRSMVAIVASTPSDGTCDVKLLNEGNTISSVKIRTGLTLNYGDYVYVTFINGSSSSFFIDEKK